MIIDRIVVVFDIFVGSMAVVDLVATLATAFVTATLVTGITFVAALVVAIIGLIGCLIASFVVSLVVDIIRSTCSLIARRSLNTRLIIDLTIILPLICLTLVGIWSNISIRSHILHS